MYYVGMYVGTFVDCSVDMYEYVHVCRFVDINVCECMHVCMYVCMGA